jgi:hypothetical protein
MSLINEVHKEYRGRGFEVVSVCFDAKTRRDQVRRIERRIGSNWITLAADELWPDISKRFGFQGFPQYMLLDREGKMVAGTSEVNLGRGLRPLLDQILNE